MDFSKYKINLQKIDNNYSKLIFIMQQDNNIKSVYATDGQISNLLNISEKEYKNILNNNFKCKFDQNKHTTYISSDKNKDEIINLLESILLMNKISNKNEKKYDARFFTIRKF
ncbi:MAG: hypothetical protein ACOCP8_05845 [archaeon]